MEKNLVEVEILTQTITADYGTLSAGDKLRTSPEFAKHLVNDAKAAKYTNKADADRAGTDPDPDAEGTRPMSADDEERNKRAGTTDAERQGTRSTGKGSKS